MSRVLAISAVNLVSGGPLSVLSDVIISLENTEFDRVDVFVNSKDIVPAVQNPSVNFIEIKYSKRNWFNRFFFEYVHCYFLAKKHRYSHWLSLHDMTPVLPKFVNQFVYCHNPSPFYKMSFLELKKDPKMYLFTKFYKYVYKTNIKSNSAIIAQQNWIGDELSKLAPNVPVIICQPEISACEGAFLEPTNNKKSGKINIIYPSLPRSFKNFEVIVDAMKILNKKGDVDVRVEFTISGFENSYSREIYKRCKDVTNIHFIGVIDRVDVLSRLSKSDLFIFPSKLETWGLPITEAKACNLPIILADLPYAKETLGSYGNAIFFDADAPQELASIIEKFVLSGFKLGEIKYNESGQSIKSWGELFTTIYQY